jgi:hypothetical protein
MVMANFLRILPQGTLGHERLGEATMGLFGKNPFFPAFFFCQQCCAAGIGLACIQWKNPQSDEARKSTK